MRVFGDSGVIQGLLAALRGKLEAGGCQVESCEASTVQASEPDW
jgi:hypothetical protein